MDSLETSDIKQNKTKRHILQRDFANGNFTFSWIFLLFHALFFFPLPGLIQGKMPHLLQQKIPGKFVPFRGLVSPAKKWQLMSIYEASEPKSEQCARGVLGKDEHFTRGKDGRGQPAQPDEREALGNLQQI